MSGNVISVSTFDRVDVQEDQKTEFKRSIFISPETHTPSAKQMHVIAETLAAFMNAEGGMLYIGVNDGGQISGMEDDLTILAKQPSTVVVHTVRHDDTTFAYGATADKYELGGNAGTVTRTNRGSTGDSNCKFHAEFSGIV